MSDFNAVLASLATLASQPRLNVLVALLLLAAIIDWRTYRIPNWLTVSGMVVGLLYNSIDPSPASGFWLALAGLGVGLVMLLPLYVLRVMGAGDVKLMAMVGAFLSVPDIIYAVLYTLITGGVAALAFAIYRRAFRRMSANVADIVQSMTFAAIAGYRPAPDMAGRISIGKLPYGVSIAVGTILWLMARLLGLA
jgi:prepilin peptidase CpaA